VPIRLAVCAGWLLFTLMVIAISWMGALLRGRQAEIGGTLIWNLGWLLWAGGTFVVAWLTRRFPIERGGLVRDIGVHVGLGIMLGVVLLVLEFLFAQALQRWVPGAPRANALLGFFVYKFHVYFLIYWMILGATRAYDYYTQFRASSVRAAQLEMQLARSQLLALQAQLHPHFLFNTHHAIVSLILKQENAAAIKMLTRLSDLLRITLAKTDRQTMPVREELEALELYLGIQRERFGERLRVEFDVDDGAREAEVPSLILQPLVENALRHGIEPGASAGLVQISLRVDGARLRVRVSDNGPGFSAEFSTERDGGIGLKNTVSRLERLYGSDAAIRFVRGVPGGADVQIELPLRMKTRSETGGQLSST
jgi:two-component system, LytTR family, sensor kinase